MLRVLPLTFKPVNNLICYKTGLMWVVKGASSLFNSFYSNVAKQVTFSGFKMSTSPPLGLYYDLIGTHNSLNGDKWYPQTSQTSLFRFENKPSSGAKRKTKIKIKVRHK